MDLLHKDLDFKVRQVGDPDERILEFIGSTADVDRYGDVIDVAGWELKHYLKNPQFLWAHNYSVPPVGTTRKVTKADGALAFQVYFPKDEEINVAGWPSHVPTPETVYRLYMGGFLRATSVGFQGLETEAILGEADEQGYRPRTGTRFKRQDLYELSAVPVPANPYALMNAVQKGIISEDQARVLQPPAEDKEKTGEDLIADLRKKVRDLEDELVLAKAQAAPLKFDMVFSEEQLDKIRSEWEAKYLGPGLVPETKAGAVLSAKNKTALKNAQIMIQQVLDAAEPAADEDGKGKEVPKKESIYSLALNPGNEPEGERQAGGSVDMGEILQLTKNLHKTAHPGK
jgi:hypothetical protein